MANIDATHKTTIPTRVALKAIRCRRFGVKRRSRNMTEHLDNACKWPQESRCSDAPKPLATPYTTTADCMVANPSIGLSV
ncbi:MAG: hypothetical protein L6R40_004695 [Gallowayella cf. fulva]|nr:MAG: hypothetical protein L6R40_004695 [Xanthomendoza cf. fulva]